MAGHFRAILLDFDYTLADSSRGIIACFEHAFNALGLPEVSHDDIRATIGLSLTDALVQLAGPLPVVAQEAFQERFRDQADAVMAGLTSLYGGVPDTTKGLKQRGYRVGIVSNKYRYRIETVLSREDLPDIDVIVGAEDVARLKPCPDGLLRAIATLGLPASEALYVGDSLTDAEAAARAGIPFVAVLSGVTPPSALADRSLAVFGGVAELPDWLDGQSVSGGPA